MKRRTIAVACVIVVVSAMLLLSFYEFNSDDDTNITFDEKYSLDKTSIFTSNDVIIISDEESVVYSELGPNVKIQKDFNSISENDVVVIDGNYVKSMQLEGSDDIKAILIELFKNGNPLILIDENPKLFEDLELSHSFSQSLNGVYCYALCKTGPTESYSIIGCGAKKSMDLAYEWAKEINDKKHCWL